MPKNLLSGHDSRGLELPLPDAAAIAHSARLVDAIAARIEDRGGVIGFDEYMQMALYEPGLGYYSAAAAKFGAPGDFVTAPEISPLFGFCLARQAAAVIAQGCSARILEFGAGSGKLCAQILSNLPTLEHYQILDLSADLKQRQQSYLRAELSAELFHKIEWLSSLPQEFDGIVLANEVLDAMPVHILSKQGEWLERCIGYDGQGFTWQSITPKQTVTDSIRSIEARLGDFAEGYQSELNLNYGPWLKALAQSCKRALVLIIDYGYEQDQYYHPSRARGTLTCHYQHRVHTDPLVYPGLQDITAFVDFDACADAAETNGFVLSGLVTQGRFLLANGLLEEAQRWAQGNDSLLQLALSQQVGTLSLPQEMGDKFKVLAMQKNMTLELPAMQRRGTYG
ncbi:MAG: SAM-dependent methyltransferase [Gammaproteobacteria bacterium]|nr:SAM-dependent methyltransferase [Gammaproteobacteria bacterium]